MKLFEKTLESALKYKCFFMKLYEDKILLPNNETSTRIYIEHDGAAAVLPITSEGKIILIKQYRYPIKKISIEVPAGKKDDINELGIDCITRELEEETGYRSNDITYIRDLHSCVGYSNEVIELFIARNCVVIENPKQGDDDEFIEVFHVSKEEAIELMKNNQITDGKTLILLQHFLLENIV